MPIRTLVYASQTAETVTAIRIRRIVADAAVFNELAGVTGLLLYDGGRFLQYLEGPQDGVDAVFKRVLASTSHLEIVELARGVVGERLLPYWPMTLVHAESNVLGRLTSSDWNGFVRRGPARPTAVDHLLAVAEQHRLNPPAVG